MANNRAINREYVEKRHADNGNASHLCRVAGKRLVNIQVKKQGGNQYNRLLICRGNVHTCVRRVGYVRGCFCDYEQLGGGRL